MKAYKITILVVDHDNVGKGIADIIESARYPNDCLSPQVMDVESVDIGEWHDAHPLNNRGVARREFARLFGVVALVLLAFASLSCALPCTAQIDPKCCAGVPCYRDPPKDAGP